MAAPYDPRPVLSRRVLAGGAPSEAARAAHLRRQDNALIRLLAGPMAPHLGPRAMRTSKVHPAGRNMTWHKGITSMARGRGGWAWLSTLRALERRLLVVKRGGAFHLTDEGRALAIVLQRERPADA